MNLIEEKFYPAENRKMKKSLRENFYLDPNKTFLTAKDIVTGINKKGYKAKNDILPSAFQSQPPPALPGSHDSIIDSADFNREFI